MKLTATVTVSSHLIYLLRVWLITFST